MKLSKKNIIILLVFDAILFGCGILAIFIPCIINNNWYSLLSIFLFSFSIIFPFLCNAFNFTSVNATEAWLFDDNNSAELGGTLAWFLFGCFLCIGFGIPFLLWRNNAMNIVNMACTMSGGAVIILSLGVFGYFFNTIKNNNEPF